jgi:prohibitin 2
MNFQGAKVPGAGGKLAVLGGAALYAVLNSFYNVEGGHRAIVFNRLEGIKDKVSLLDRSALVVVVDRGYGF